LLHWTLLAFLIFLLDLNSFNPSLKIYALHMNSISIIVGFRQAHRVQWISNKHEQQIHNCKSLCYITLNLKFFPYLAIDT
jgi:disulfide bond formation protein DsbB